MGYQLIINIAYGVICIFITVCTIADIPSSWDLTKRRMNDKTYNKQNRWWKFSELMSFVSPYVFVSVGMVIGWAFLNLIALSFE